MNEYNLNSTDDLFLKIEQTLPVKEVTQDRGVVTGEQYVDFAYQGLESDTILPKLLDAAWGDFSAWSNARNNAAIYWRTKPTHTVFVPFDDPQAISRVYLRYFISGQMVIPDVSLGDNPVRDIRDVVWITE